MRFILYHDHFCLSRDFAQVHSSEVQVEVAYYSVLAQQYFGLKVFWKLNNVTTTMMGRSFTHLGRNKGIDRTFFGYSF